jgi:hypothetical protein
MNQSPQLSTKLFIIYELIAAPFPFSFFLSPFNMMYTTISTPDVSRRFYVPYLNVVMGLIPNKKHMITIYMYVYVYITLVVHL